MKDFIWDGNKRGLMRLDYTAKITEKGGLGMTDLKKRMKAIDIMWLKKYLDTPEKRPTWCWVADTLIKGDTYLHSTPRVEESARLKWALQTWRTRQGTHSKLPDCIKRMLKAAKIYDTRVQARKTDSGLKENIIIWHHTYGTRNNYNMNKPASKCLRNNHKIKTVREMKVINVDEEPFRNVRNITARIWLRNCWKHWEINGTQSSAFHTNITWTTHQEGEKPIKKLET